MSSDCMRRSPSSAGSEHRPTNSGGILPWSSAMVRSEPVPNTDPRGCRRSGTAAPGNFTRPSPLLRGRTADPAGHDPAEHPFATPGALPRSPVDLPQRLAADSQASGGDPGAPGVRTFLAGAVLAACFLALPLYGEQLILWIAGAR